VSPRRTHHGMRIIMIAIRFASWGVAATAVEDVIAIGEGQA